VKNSITRKFTITYFVFFAIYYQDEQIKKDRMIRAHSTYGEITHAYKMPVVKPNWRRLFRRLEHNIKMGLKTTAEESVNWTVWLRVVTYCWLL
jgi:hypothetical protein